MLTDQEKAFLVAVLRELRFAPEAADNAVFARELIKKLSVSEPVEEVVSKQTETNN